MLLKFLYLNRVILAQYQFHTKQVRSLSRRDKSEGLCFDDIKN